MTYGRPEKPSPVCFCVWRGVVVESVGPCLRRGTFAAAGKKYLAEGIPAPKQNERRRHCLRRSWLPYSEYRSADHPARCRRDPLACHRGTVPRASPPSAPAERTALPPQAPPARRTLPSVPLLPAAGPARSPRTAPLRRAAARPPAAARQGASRRTQTARPRAG